MKDTIKNHKHLIKHLTGMSRDKVILALDNILKTKLINKTMYKQILKEVTMDGIERKNYLDEIKVIDGVEYKRNTFELDHMNITEEDLKLAKQMYSGLELEPPNDLIKDFEKEVRETCKEFEPDSEDEEEDENGN